MAASASRRSAIISAGLLATPEHGDGIRRYGEVDRRRLRFIRSAQAAGFTLDQIAELLVLDTTDDRARARTIAEEQLEVLERRIAELQSARHALSQLAGKCSAGGDGPCPILEAFT